MILPEFYKPYVDLFDDEDGISILKIETNKAFKFYDNITESISTKKYQSDKWSIRQLLGHIADAEQIFAFRLLSILRNEQNALPGFDHNEYVLNANFENQKWTEIKDRFKMLRYCTLSLCKEIKEEDLSKTGNANGSNISVNALLLVIAGHEKHHRLIIEERYLT